MIWWFASCLRVVKHLSNMLEKKPRDTFSRKRKRHEEKNLSSWASIWNKQMDSLLNVFLVHHEDFCYNWSTWIGNLQKRKKPCFFCMCFAFFWSLFPRGILGDKPSALPLVLLPPLSPSWMKGLLLLNAGWVRQVLMCHFLQWQDLSADVLLGLYCQG